MNKGTKIILLILVVSFAAWYFVAPVDEYPLFDEDREGIDFVMEPSDCFPDETYDATKKICYIDFECDTDVECAALEEEYYNNLLYISEEYYDGDETYKEINKGVFDEIFDEGIALNIDESIEEYTLVTYKILEGELGAATIHDSPAQYSALQKDKVKHKDLWSYYRSLVPAEYLALVSELGIYTDGPDETTAAVEQDERDPSKWVLIIDIVDAYPDGTIDKKGLIYSLLHEFAHILTLNSTQVDVDKALLVAGEGDKYSELYSKGRLECLPQFFTGEGCSKVSSYINQFFRIYWKDIYFELDDILLIEEDDAYYEAFDAFYSKYEDRFVTDYAATNPGEDIAESFYAFVLKEKPLGDSIAEQKVRFFYHYPELTRLRTLMRSRL